MAIQMENKGTSTPVAQPTDVESLHTKDVGDFPKGSKKNLDQFVDIYKQPPLSRFFATVDLKGIENGPDVRKNEYKPVKNPAFKRAMTVSVGSINGREFNSFDVEVMYEALKIARMMVTQRLEMALMNYSEVENKFSMTWEGERNNVF